MGAVTAEGLVKPGGMGWWAVEIPGLSTMVKSVKS